MTTALAPSNNYLLAMPFIENAYDYNCTPYGQVGLADTSYHHIKTEFDDNNHALLSHKQQLLNDESTCSLSLPSVSSSGQSSPQQTVPTLLMSSALCGYASDENNHPIKTEDFQYDQLDFDSVSSSEPSPVTGSFNDLDIMLNPPPVPQQSTYYHHQHHHHHHHHQAPQKMCNEDDAASDNSYPSPVLIENDMPFNLQENIYQNYCDVLSRSHHSANNTGLEQGAQIDQMRFILYEPANDGTALVPTINSNNSPIAPPALWSTSLTSVSTSTTAQSTLSFPFDYISSQNALPGTSLTPPTTALQSTHARTHSTTQGQTTQQTPIKCPQPDCPKTFSRLYNLKAHLRSHSPARPYQCPMCPRSFSRKHDLQRHIRVHTGVKPYQCPACHKAFARTDALRRHLKVEPACRESEACQNMKSNRKRYNQEMH